MISKRPLYQDPKVSQEESASDRKEKHEIRGPHIRSSTCIWRFALKRESLYTILIGDFRLKLSPPVLTWFSRAEEGVPCGGGPEPRRLPLDVLTRGREDGEMACSLEFAGVVYKKREWAALGVGAPPGERKGVPLTLPLAFLKSKAVKEELAGY